jgi:hypothetical protein
VSKTCLSAAGAATYLGAVPPSPRALLLLSALVAGVLPLVAPAAPASAAVSGVTAGQSTYVPLAPSRVLDTATQTGGHPAPFTAGETYDLPLPALPAGATAVVLNVTADRPDAKTVVRVYPTPANGTDVPTVSNLNVPQGQTLADLVVSKVATRTDGVKQVRLRNDSGTVRLVADLSGYYVGNGSGAGFTSTAPVRLLDTRQTGTPLTRGESRSFDTKTAADGTASGVPVGATAVVVNVTAIAPTTYTVVRVYPDGSAFPTVSNLNPAAGATVPNLVVVAVGNGERIRLASSSGTTDFAVDLAGWYVPGSGDVFHPVDPYRALDTRKTTNALQADTERPVTLGGTGAVPFSASALALTVTAVQPSTETYLTVHPVDGQPRPVASNLNTTAGRDVPNAVVVRAGQSGRISIYNLSGAVHVLVDVAGWFGPPGEGYDLGWPQCTPMRTSTTSKHPAAGAFAVVGVTNGKPYTVNACLAEQFAWARSLPGGGAAYLLLDAPGSGDPNHNWGAHRSPQYCDGTTSSSCGYDYGWWAADLAVSSGLPADKQGGTPQVWLDVEGPYSSGPVWQANTAVNAAVVQGAVDRLRSASIRTGAYSRVSDWTKITGGLTVPDLQQWVFPALDTPSAAGLCTPDHAFTDGTVVLGQYQTQVSGTTYDTDHAC